MSQKSLRTNAVTLTLSIALITPLAMHAETRRSMDSTTSSPRIEWIEAVGSFLTRGWEGVAGLFGDLGLGMDGNGIARDLGLGMDGNGLAAPVAPPTAD